MKKFFSSLFDLIKIVLVTLAIVIPIRYFLFQPFFVKGESMKPNFDNNQYLIVNEIDYRFSQPQRGDVIVFRYPRNPQIYFIKRVIGLPGEKIEIKNNRITIYNQDHPKGLILKENYLPSRTATNGNISILLKNDEYFVMGDNRLFSYDSRRFGPVKRNLIIGKAWLSIWPLETITTPKY